jgi:uncharacterized protein YndB with AHSA1/START domain
MNLQTATLENTTLDIEQHIDVKAPIEKTFEGLLNQISEGNVIMPMKLERWPGGRWFRDLGEGVGHLWGFVQVIKPPTLLELQGPMFMSYPVAGHIQFRLTPADGGTRITLRHRAFGLIDDNHREGVGAGWLKMIEAVKGYCE